MRLARRHKTLCAQERTPQAASRDEAVGKTR